MATFSPIRVFLVDDSPLSLTILKRMLATSPDIEVVGTARNGKEALEQFPTARPKVICTDYMMPVMNGLELIQEAMVKYPRPILVISSVIDSKEGDTAGALLEAGAVDIFPKPTGAGVPGNPAFDETARQLVQKIRILAGVFVFTRHNKEQGPLKVRPPEPQTTKTTTTGLPSRRFSPPRSKVRMIAVGSSTGGPQILQSLFAGLPAKFPYPIVCVQHISKGFLNGLVDWLRTQCQIRIKIADEGEEALPGTIYFPQEDSHLEIDGRNRLTLSPAPLMDGHRPSVTATFNSVAQRYKSNGMGILLTGMGSDGASGLQALHQAGGVTIAQDEASCVVFGMPKKAIELGAAQYIMSPEQISQALQTLASGQRGAPTRLDYSISPHKPC